MKPSITRRGFELIAAEFATLRKIHANHADKNDPKWHEGYETCLDDIQENISRALARQHPRFNAEKFNKACKPINGNL